MPLSNYEVLYDELGDLLKDETLLEKVGDVVTRHMVDAYARGRDYGQHLALDEREKIWEVGCSREVPINKLPKNTRADIRECVNENTPKRPPRSPRECLNVVLEWNGAVGFTDDVVTAMIGIERALLRDLAPHELTKAHLENTRL